MGNYENWDCPFCNRPQLIAPEQRITVLAPIKLQKHKYLSLRLGLIVKAYACSNASCGEVSLDAEFVTGRSVGDGPFRSNNLVEKYRLRPNSSSKPQPEFIPQPLREDYNEACLIKDSSPKAAATLARRCIQGMIRDFCGVSGRTLFQEIDEVRKLWDSGNAPKGVTIETIEAMDHVRSIGNYGAHMEKDINFIVPVEPGEAQALIELIEILFDEWYVARDRRETRLARIKAISIEKDQIADAHKSDSAKDQTPEISTEIDPSPDGNQA